MSTAASARFFLFTRRHYWHRKLEGGTYWSEVELGRLVPSRLVMYSVFRNHVTVGTACDELEPPAELLTNNDDPTVESPSRNWSLGSSFGRFFGSGFSAIRKTRSGHHEFAKRRPQPGLSEVQHSPESSPSSVHKHSHNPKSSGIPHSASTIIGRGVSLARVSRNSGRAYLMGSVGISRSFGGHGGAGSGFE